jgi:hypothetical protein
MIKLAGLKVMLSSWKLGFKLGMFYVNRVGDKVIMEDIKGNKENTITTL